MTKRAMWMGAVLMAAVFVSFGASPVRAAETLESVNCSDTYRFGSIEAELSSPITATVSGATLHLNATLRNNNPYPITEGTLYLKVFKSRTSRLAETENFFETLPAENQVKNGSPLMVQFMAAEHITLKANETKTISFDYRLPNALPSGEYSLVSFVQVASRFNYLGLSFTDDITGNSFPFTVTNPESAGAVEWDKDGVTLGGAAHRFAAFTKSFPKDQSVPIVAPLVNTTKEEQAVAVTWTTYSWDALLAEHRLAEDTQTVVLKAGEKRTLTYTVKPNAASVNLVVAKVAYRDMTSLLDIRFTREGNVGARLNSLSLGAYPLTDGHATINVCAHTTMPQVMAIGEPTLPGKDGKRPEAVPRNDLVEYSLTVALEDEAGKIIDTVAYQGPLGGSIQGFTTTLKDVPVGSLTLRATLTDAKGTTVDTAVLPYRCEDLGGCPAKNTQVVNGFPDVSESFPGKTLVWLFSGLGIIVLIVVWGWRKRRESSRTIMSLVLLAVSGILWGGLSQPVSAQSFEIQSVVQSKRQTIESIELAPLGYRSMSAEYSGVYWIASVGNTHADVRYTVQTVDLEGNDLPDTAVLHPGDRFRVFDRTLTDPESIYWFLNGFSLDSPYGHWQKEATYPDNFKEAESEKVYNENVGCCNNYKLYSSLMLNPPTLTLETSGPVQCQVGGGGRAWTCWVTEPERPGEQIRLKLSYADTYGNFYYTHRAVGHVTGVYSGMYQSHHKVSPYTLYSEIMFFPPSAHAFSSDQGGCHWWSTSPMPEVGQCLPTSYIDWNVGLPYCSSSRDAEDWFRVGSSYAIDTCEQNDAHNIPVPGTTLTVVHTVESLSAAPSAPTLTVTPAPLKESEMGTFTVAGSIDPDEGDTLKYQIIYAACANPNTGVCTAQEETGYLPADGSATHDFHYAYAASGVQRPWARACDNHGACSAWVQKPVNVRTLSPSLVVCPLTAAVALHGTTELSSRYVADGSVTCNSPTGSYTDVTEGAEWTSTDTSIATVNNTGSSKGTVTGAAVGDTTIRASYGGLSANASVDVTCVGTYDCTSDPRTQSICTGKTFQAENNCGNTVTCYGKRSCDFNYKEVAP